MHNLEFKILSLIRLWSATSGGIIVPAGTIMLPPPVGASRIAACEQNRGTHVHPKFQAGAPEASRADRKVLAALFTTLFPCAGTFGPPWSGCPPLFKFWTTSMAFPSAGTFPPSGWVCPAPQPLYHGFCSYSLSHLALGGSVYSSRNGPGLCVRSHSSARCSRARALAVCSAIRSSWVCGRPSCWFQLPANIPRPSRQ